MRSLLRNEGVRTAERFGWYPKIHLSSPTIWVHAVSVGEFMASTPIIKWLLDSKSPNRVVVTTTTMSASILVERTFGCSVDHVFLPYDIPTFLRRFFRKFKPYKLVLLETELWPNLLRLCEKDGIPVFLINARISCSSFNSYQNLKKVMSHPIGSITKIVAQNAVYADRFRKLGYPEGSITVSGNLKFDVKADSMVSSDMLNSLKTLVSDRKVLVCGSTREGEEAIILKAFLTLKDKFKDLLILLVPRHPNRSKEVGGICSDLGLAYEFRSRGIKSLAKKVDVFIVDTIGELMTCYSIAQLAFVGGSLVPHGGHNILEPGRFGVPILVGPFTKNFEDEIRLLSSVGALKVVRDENEIVKSISLWLSDDGERVRLGELGSEAIREESGALERTLKVLTQG